MANTLSTAQVGSVSVGNGCPAGKVKLMGQCVSVAPAIGGTVGTVSTANIGGHPLNPTPPATGSGNNATQTQTAQTMPNIPLNGATIQPAIGSGTVGTATTVSTVGVGVNAGTAAGNTDDQPWYKKYLWLEVAAAVIVLAVALWLIFRKKK